MLLYYLKTNNYWLVELVKHLELMPKPSHEKANKFGFDLKGGGMASDAFFPFPIVLNLLIKQVFPL